jgi:hypothetical protein
MEDNNMETTDSDSKEDKPSSSDSSFNSSSTENEILSRKDKRAKESAKKLLDHNVLQQKISAISKKQKKNKNNKRTAKNLLSAEKTSDKTSPREKGLSSKKCKKNSVAEDSVEDDSAPQSRVRTPNFSADENLCLATAWCSASENSVAGCSRKKEVFWRTVKVYFDSLLTDISDDDCPVLHNRSWQSLWNKWTRNINPDVMVFLSYYAPYKDNPPSGWNEEKIREEAMKAYKEKEGTTFKYLNCLDTLKDHPKYNVDTSGAATAAAEAGTNNTSTVMGGSLARPMGKKKTQRMKQISNTLESCASSVADTKPSAVRTSSLGTAGSFVTAVAESIDRLNHTFIQQGTKQEAEALMASYLKSAEMYMKMGRTHDANACMTKWEQACDEKERKMKENESSSLLFSASNAMLNCQDYAVPKTIATPSRNNNHSDDIVPDADIDLQEDTSEENNHE